MKSKDLFELPEPLSVFSEFFKPEAEPWTWVKNIGKALESLDFSKLDSKKDIPAGVEIMNHLDLFMETWFYIIAVSFISLLTTFLAAAKAVEITERLMARKGGRE